MQIQKLQHMRDFYGKRKFLSGLLLPRKLESIFLVCLICQLLTKDSVGRIHGHLIFGSIANQAFRVGEGDIRRRHTIALIIGDNLHFAVLKNAHARIGGAQVNAHSFGHVRALFLKIGASYTLAAVLCVIARLECCNF